MSTKNIYANCDVCGGDGKVVKLVIDSETQSQEWAESGCPKCAGVGTRLSGTLDSDLIDLLNDILDKVIDIKEKVDTLQGNRY